jgi:CubicO group peptidase (beta-lactamase class C family)
MTGGNLELTPREMAKVGQLVLDRGRAGGKQVVPARWIEQSCTPLVDEPVSGYRYGLLWWLGNPQTDDPSLPSCHASGNGGQKIFVFPTADLVVVFTGSSYNKARYSHQQPVVMLNRFILPALTS